VLERRGVSEARRLLWELLLAGDGRGWRASEGGNDGHECKDQRGGDTSRQQNRNATRTKKGRDHEQGRTHVCRIHHVDDRIRSSCIPIPHIPKLWLTLNRPNQKSKSLRQPRSSEYIPASHFALLVPSQISGVTAKDVQTHTQIPDLHVHVPLLDLFQVERYGGYHIRAELVGR
jgi:hypothetical protein